MQTKLFINGEFVDSAARGRIPVLNPYDNSQICEISEARAEDVDLAVEFATAAQKTWGRSDASQRGRLLLKLADAIEANAEELIQLESRDTGHPVRDARKLDVPGHKDSATLRKELRDNVLSSADLFKVKPFFLSDKFSMVDATIAPILWRLPRYEIDLPPQAQPILKYANNIFSRPAFRASLSENEREMRLA